jgi:hypothetical protein
MAESHPFDGALQRVEQLREYYDAPMEVAVRKDIARIDELCRRLIAAAPCCSSRPSRATGGAT